MRGVTGTSATDVGVLPVRRARSPPTWDPDLAARGSASCSPPRPAATASTSCSRPTGQPAPHARSAAGTSSATARTRCSPPRSPAAFVDGVQDRRRRRMRQALRRQRLRDRPHHLRRRASTSGRCARSTSRLRAAGPEAGPGRSWAPTTRVDDGDRRTDRARARCSPRPQGRVGLRRRRRERLAGHAVDRGVGERRPGPRHARARRPVGRRTCSPPCATADVDESRRSTTRSLRLCAWPQRVGALEGLAPSGGRARPRGDVDGRGVLREPAPRSMVVLRDDERALPARPRRRPRIALARPQRRRTRSCRAAARLRRAGPRRRPPRSALRDAFAGAEITIAARRGRPGRLPPPLDLAGRVHHPEGHRGRAGELLDADGAVLRRGPTATSGTAGCARSPGRAAAAAHQRRRSGSTSPAGTSSASARSGTARRHVDGEVLVRRGRRRVGAEVVLDST